MSFLGWHYSFGVKFYLNRYTSTIAWVNHYFSLPLLLKSLFSPWKRLAAVDNKKGFNLNRWLQTSSFNFVSRFMGAIVRFVLFVVGILFLISVIIFGGIGFLVWIILPVLSANLYTASKKNPEYIANQIAASIKADPKHILDKVLSTDPGKFFTEHLGVNRTDLINAAKQDVEIGMEGVKSYADIISLLIRGNFWSDSELNKLNLSKSDLINAASWWDTKQGNKFNLQLKRGFDRPGIGVDLLTGFTPTLDQFSTDLGASQPFSHHLIGRQNVVSRLERSLVGGTGVVLVGPPGIGKKTVVMEFAKRAGARELGPKMAYKRVLEFDHNFLLSDTTDINQKKVRFANILSEASAAGNIILVFRDLHRLTDESLEGINLTDVFEQFLETRKLQVIAIATHNEYERYIARNARLRKFFETVEVIEPTMDEAMQIILQSADTWETRKGILATVPALRKILEGSDQYITDTPFPEKALELLDAVIMFEEQRSEDLIITVDDVNTVLSEKTGISFARLTSQEKKKLGNLENIIHEKLVNQEAAVTLISQILRGKSVGVVSNKRPLGSFLFLGPTGVGKTQTAKVLADVYFGSEKQIIRFDMAEYSGAEGLERLIGSVNKNQPGTLTTAIKNHPASLLLLDEIEKATPQVFNLFLSLLDEGKITDAFNKTVNAKNIFIVGTSNAGSEFIRQNISKLSGEELTKGVIDFVLSQKIFTPEFINRFDGAVVYEPLKPEHLVKIARLLVNDMAENLKSKNIYMEVTDEAISKIAQEGYDPAFGARPMRRIIELNIGDLIGKAMLSGEVADGAKIKIISGNEKGVYSFEHLS